MGEGPETRPEDPAPAPAGGEGGPLRFDPEIGRWVEFMAQAFKESPFSFQIFDGEGHPVYANSKHGEIFGMSPPPCYTLFDDILLKREGYEPNLQQLKTGKAAYFPLLWYNPSEFCPMAKDRRRCVTGFVVPVMDRGGKLTLLLAFHEDVTERMLAQEEVRKRSEALDRRVRELTCLCGVSRMVAEDRAGLGEILEEAVRCLPPAFGRAGSVAARARVGSLERESAGFGSGGAVLSAEVRAGKEAIGSVEVEVAGGKEGETTLLPEEREVLETVGGLLGIAVERSRAREAALRSERLAAVGTLASGIVHDFGNMLAGIVGQAGMLAEEPGLSGKGRRHVEVIQRAGVEARELVKRLREMSGHGEGNLERVDVHEAIGQVCHLMEHAVARKVRVEKRLEASRSEILGDALQLQNMLLNLGINAREAMPEGGTVTFATSNAPGSDGGPGALRMEVRDTGKGMSPERAARIGEPFLTAKADGEGSGLGLYNVRRCVQRHGATMRVETREGSGTAISIEFEPAPPERSM
ncbi:MAG: ATP-binding protein [Planctomycetes bacterium]|nr:ATP-binding protein [Planctomycetota bacterium]